MNTDDVRTMIYYIQHKNYSEEEDQTCNGTYIYRTSGKGTVEFIDHSTRQTSTGHFTYDQDSKSITMTFKGKTVTMTFTRGF